jgi:uncharacterized damage-inducible protein DinB
METATAKAYNIATGLIAELTQEATTTRKILERIPAEKFDYKPHEKSMTMSRLATHVVEMVDWITETCTKDELDFATMDYKPFEPKTAAELVEYHDKLIGKALEVLKNTSDEDMHKPWTLKNGETIYFTTFPCRKFTVRRRTKVKCRKNGTQSDFDSTVHRS